MTYSFPMRNTNLSESDLLSKWTMAKKDLKTCQATHKNSDLKATQSYWQSTKWTPAQSPDERARLLLQLSALKNVVKCSGKSVSQQDRSKKTTTHYKSVT